MSSGFIDLIRKLRPFDDEEKQGLESVRLFIDAKRFKLIKNLLKEKKISIKKSNIESSLIEDIEFPVVIAKSKKIDTKNVNEDIKKKVMEKTFKHFSEKAYDIIPKLIAPNISGMEDIKKAVTLQLFSSQPIHILLLGDPGTGKTDILRSAFSLSPISSFGLGSGTSGVGLVVSVKGNKIMKGILPLADNGICCIDELNLMKEDNRAGLYNAMEKGFVTYDKGGYHYKFDAKVKVLATANPKGDKFTGKTVADLRKELPFDSALLTRFHLNFFIRKPGIEKFKKIANKIVSQENTELSEGEIEFVRSYIENSSKKEVGEISKNIQTKIVNFMAELKKDENNYLIEISPRLIIGFMRLCKALAKLELRHSVEEKDFDRVKELIKNSLII